MVLASWVLRLSKDQTHHLDIRIGFIHQPSHPVGEVPAWCAVGSSPPAARGSQARNKLRVLSRRYSQSCRNSLPG